MGNDDVICLSSDDETTPVQTPIENPKGTAGPVKSEVEPSVRWSLNRKRPGSVLNASKLNNVKKPKVCSYGPEQEVSDSLSAGSTDKVSQSTSNAKKVDLTQIRCVRKSTGEPVTFNSRSSGLCKQKSTPRVLQTPEREIPNTPSARSTEKVSQSTSNAKKVDSKYIECVRKSTGQTCYLRRSDFSKQKSTPEVLQSEPKRSRSTDHNETLSNKIKAGNPESQNSLSKQKSQSQTHLNSISKNELSLSNGSKALEEKKKSEKTIARHGQKTMPLREKTKIPVMNKIAEEICNLSNAKITTAGNLSKILVAKQQEKTTSETVKLPEPNRRSSSDKNPRDQSANNTPKITCTKSENLRKLAEEFERLIGQKSTTVTVNQNIAQDSSVPEIVIVDGPESSENGSLGSNKKVNGKCEKLRSSVESSERTNKSNGSEPQKSRCSTIASSSNEENKVCKDIEHVSSSRKDPPGTETSFGKEGSQSKSTPKAFRTSLESEKIDAVKKPTRITSLQLNKPKSNESNLRDHDNTRNGRVSTSSESENNKKSKEPFKPVAGCSKTPDVVIWAETKKKKLKSTPDPSFMTTPWQQQENHETEEKPETLQQHKSSGKPHLVVKTKEPASVEQDTFAMFLSLCLQVERSPEMEKIVAKLKRNYDQLDPVYSRSRIFSDFLNDIREKILAKGRIYSYISRVADEMKFRRKKSEASATNDKKEETNGPGTKESSTEVNNDHENSHESRRLRQKIKTIEMTMKQCAKRIRQYEEAEVDLDDDNNSNYIKLERYKRRMVELYTQLCRYTNEHPDAGRSYLRPKHLRVTQIPSIDQAINSFINSKLSYNRKKSGKSFVDGLIFPDYVDILECVGKVNDEQKLGLDKRRQQQLAKEAFTQLGKTLQEARQRDYWDTFSENLENSEDPAAADPTLAEKLSDNKKIAEKRTAEIFEEYVRKQEQRNEVDEESTNSESGHDEEDEEEDDEDDEEKGDRDVSDVEISDTEDAASCGGNAKEKNPLQLPELSAEAERECESLSDDAANAGPEIEENIALESVEKTIKNSDKMPNLQEKSSVDDKPKEIAVNHVEDGCDEVIEILELVPKIQSPREKMDEDSVAEAETAETKQNDESSKPEIDGACAKENGDVKTASDKATDSLTTANGSASTEAPEIEVSHAETDTEGETIEPVIDQPKVLRIRSFAKPPSSWASSQQLNQEDDAIKAPDSEAPINAETIDLLDDEPENGASKVPESPKIATEARLALTTTTNPESPRKEKPVVEVSRKLEETPLSVKTNRSTIVIRSPNKSSPNQLLKITKQNPDQELSVQKKITITRNLPSSLGQSESFKNRLNRDPSVQMDKPIAPIFQTSPRNRPFAQNRPQQSSVQKPIAVASSSKISPENRQFQQIRVQQNFTYEKQTAVAPNRPQQSSQVQKPPATIFQSPRKNQLNENLQRQSLSSEKPIVTSRTATTSCANSQSNQNRVRQYLAAPKLIITPKGGAETSHKTSSSMPNSLAMSQSPFLSPADRQIIINYLAQSVALQKLLVRARTPGGGNVKASPNVSQQTATEKVRTQNIEHNIPSQDGSLNLVNRRVFSLDSPQSIEIKNPGKVQNLFSRDQLKTVKLVVNNNQIRLNSNIPKVNNDDNNNKTNECPRIMIKNLPSANTAQNSSGLQAGSLATATNPIRPGLLAAQHKLQTKPSNMQPLVKLRVDPNPQILHSVQQQLINVSKATIRPLGVTSIQAQGITLKNPRIIKLPGRPTIADSTAARTVAYPPILQNPFQRPAPSASSTNSNRPVQCVNSRPTIQRTNYVLKPHTSNNAQPNCEQPQKFKLAAPNFTPTPHNNAPPKK